MTRLNTFIFSARKTAATAVVALLVTLSVLSSHASAARFDEDQVKGAFIYNLAHFITWPETSFVGEDSPFEIAVFNEKNLHHILKEIAEGESVDKHPIKVRYITKAQDIGSPHILYLPESAKSVTTDMIKKPQTGILTISDYSAFVIKDNGAISLLVKNKKVRLVLNHITIKKAELKASSKLLQVAEIVGRD